MIGPSPDRPGCGAIGDDLECGGAGARPRQTSRPDQGHRQGAARGVGRRRPIPAADDRVDGPSAPSRLAAPAATARSGSAWALRETGGQLVTIEYDPVRAKELAENIKRSRADRHRPGGGRRRVPADPEAARARSTSCSSMRGRRTTSVLRHGLPAARQGRPVPRAQRRQQAQRDGGLPRRDSEATRPSGRRSCRRRARECRCR